MSEEQKHRDDIELEKLKLKVDVWKTVIDVQKHFNDLEMKVRNFGILILSAFIGAIGVSFNSDATLSILGHGFPIAAILALGALIVWLLFYFVDIYWYHPLLLGAVKQGLKIEKELKTDIPNIDLTQTIGECSPKKIFNYFEMHSTDKAKIFYIGVSMVLLFTCLFLTFFDAPPKTNQINTINLEATCSRNINYGSTVKCYINSPLVEKQKSGDIKTNK